MEGTKTKRKCRLVAAVYTRLGGMSWCISLGATSRPASRMASKQLPPATRAFWLSRSGGITGGVLAGSDGPLGAPRVPSAMACQVDHGCCSRPQPDLKGWGWGGPIDPKIVVRKNLGGGLLGSGTPPSLPSLPSGPTCLPRVNSYWPYIWRCQRRPKMFLIPLAHFPHFGPQTLSLNPTLTLTPTPTLSQLLTLSPKLTLDPNQDSIFRPSWWGKECRLGDFNDK